MDTSKIIKGVVNSGRYTVTVPIVKEDYGLYLQIEGVELPSTYEVDFSNSESSGTSVTMIGNADGVLIPRQFIDSGKDVFAFLYHVGEDFGRTVYKFRIPNKVRPDRTNEEPTPEEQSVIDQAINALNSAVEQTAQDVISADQSAQSASEDAGRAEEARTDAQNYATQAEQARDDAQTYANNASASATASANSASASAQIKSDVEDLVDDAQGYAQASERSASASANSASQAQGFAQSASASAQSASGYASQAQSSAQTAFNKASEASTSAQTASQKATEAAQSATDAQGYAQTAETAKMDAQTAQGLAESARDSAVQAKTDAESAKADAETARDEAQQAVASISGALADKAPIITDTASGSIASFSDGADDLPLKSLVIDINPVQDLHGQDAPYPAGGGKNLVNVVSPQTLTSQTELARFLTSEKTTFTLSATIVNNASVTGALNIYLYNENSYVAYKQVAIPANAPSARYSVSMDTSEYTFNQIRAVITGASAGYSLTVSNVQLEKSATATDWSPYENLCPISGWTSVDVEQRGVNVWDEEWEVGTINNATGVNENDARYIRSKNYCTILPSTSYCIKPPSTELVRIFWYDAEKNFISNTASASGSPTVVSSPSNAKYFKFKCFITTYNHDISINYPSTDHDYHPYTGRSIAIQLGQTVYGGKVDVLTGELVIDRAMVDLGTLRWFKTDNHFYAVDIKNLVKAPLDNYAVANILCTQYKTESLANVYNETVDKSIAIQVTPVASQGNITIYDSAYSSNTGAEFKEVMNGVMLCYELAEPIEIQLSANHINSLLGVNNIWADSGDTEVVYRADTKAYIAKKIAEALASLT